MITRRGAMFTLTHRDTFAHYHHNCKPPASAPRQRCWSWLPAFCGLCRRSVPGTRAAAHPVLPPPSSSRPWHIAPVVLATDIKHIRYSPCGCAGGLGADGRKRIRPGLREIPRTLPDVAAGSGGCTGRPQTPVPPWLCRRVYTYGQGQSITGGRPYTATLARKRIWQGKRGLCVCEFHAGKPALRCFLWNLP